MERRLAACVNIADIASVYRWQGKVEKADEKLLIIKTSESLFEQLEQFIRQNHSYRCPEIIALEIKAGSPEYLKWVQSETK